MAPAPVLMDVDQEEKPGSSVKSVMEKENRIALKVKDDADLRCTNNCEDNSFHAETLLDQQKIDEMVEPEVNIIDCADTSVRLTKAEEDPDATEYSSSFGNTMSGSGDGLRVNSSDDELESQFCHDNGSSKYFGPEFAAVFKDDTIAANFLVSGPVILKLNKQDKMSNDVIYA
ncbi:hypothetical protein ACLOJK_030203 [Asimina triloba]